MGLLRRSDQLVKCLRWATSPEFPAAVFRTLAIDSLHTGVAVCSARSFGSLARPPLHAPVWSNVQAFGVSALFGQQRTFAAEAVAKQYVFIALNNIRDNPGATKQKRRVGRGTGSGRGKTCGRGHKGQKARSGSGPKLGFEGGQTPLRIAAPKKGAVRAPKPYSVLSQMQQLDYVNLDKLSSWIQQGRLPSDQTITMKMLRDSRCISKKVDFGVKLMGRGSAEWNLPINIEVTATTDNARAAVEKAGGKVTTVYYNPLALRALLKPEWFAKKGRRLPRVAQPPPKLAPFFERMGTLPPSDPPTPTQLPTSAAEPSTAANATTA